VSGENHKLRSAIILIPPSIFKEAELGRACRKSRNDVDKKKLVAAT
jgi:hypothetical protein